ncbi:MAG TPA: hypothetical protein VD815_07410 [Candidatus Saccharimonadales bacterium]|nr:hypothetical protein [Candidatus Saccharimonadales bacterium]
MKRYTIKLFYTSLLFAASLSTLTIYSFSTVLADPFGIFNYDNPAIVTIQGLRAHLFEAHDATHKANSSEIVMHLKMADEEISHFLQNLTSGNSSQTQNSNLSDTLSTFQMQLNNTKSTASTGNMTGVMDELKHADEYLVNSLKGLGYTQDKNLTTA